MRAHDDPAAIPVGELRRIVTEDMATAKARAHHLASADLVPWLCRCGAQGAAVTAENAARDWSVHAHTAGCTTVPITDILRQVAA